MTQELVQMETFLGNFARQLDPPCPTPLSAGTMFRDLTGWTSLQSVVLVVSLDKDYGVTISGEELRRAQTVGDLWQLVRRKQGA